MKKIYLLALILFSQQLFSQYVSTGIGKWKLGLNVGATWQTADVSTDLFDVGYGATLEYAVYEKQHSFFGFSFRGRFLQGKTTGYNYLAHEGVISNNAINGSIDTTLNYSFQPLYLNNKTSFNEFSLEGMLKWNRLYQNHGVLFYLYLGGGFTNFKIETDQLDFDGSMYNYSSINGSNGISAVDDIKNFQDGNYETELSNPDYNTLVFTPAVGVGLGFRIVPGVDFALEHKVSLPQTDLFDGQIYESNDPSFIQDIYHYTSLGLIFSIVHRTDPQSYVPPVEPTTPITTLTSTPIKPIITLTQPVINTFNTPNCKIEIIAKIENVTEQKDIEFYHNGNKVPSYKYFFSPPTFKSTIELTEGNNNFKIVAKNGNLTDTKDFSLTCKNNVNIPICHKLIDGSFINTTILEKEWPQHAAHGDSKGNCPEKQITICHYVPGGLGKTETISIPESTWAIHKSHGDVLGNCSEKALITICHNNQAISIDEKDWVSHAAHGDTKGNCPQVNMITICHVPAQGNQRVTMSIKDTEWIVHQAHGDYKGTCPTVVPTISICHKNQNGSKTNMTIPEFRWNEHFSHGDSKGACPEVSFIICHKNPSTGKKTNISIYESGWPQHAAHGDTKGECPVIETQITICHKIPGQFGKTETISIPESKWLIHKSHGDALGECVVQENKILICHFNAATGKKETINIKESEWALHASHGDTKGACPKPIKQIKICHQITGGGTQTITIPENQWSNHLSHGDQLGECPRPIKYITICHKTPGRNNLTETLSIPESDWNLHQAHGDQLGACVIVDNDISICHHSGNTKTQMTIKESLWSQHAAHGDTKGICPKDNSPSDPNGGGASTGNDKKISICHHVSIEFSTWINMEINESEWKTHQLHGDTQGLCPKDNSTSDPNGSGNNSGGSGGHGNAGGSEKMTICHYPPGNTTSPETIEIDASEWRAHQLHGDSAGECGSNIKKSGGKELIKGESPGIKGKKP